MADGYAQATGNASFVNLHSAAGVGNAMGKLFTAFKNRAPIILTAGQQACSILPFDSYLGSRDAAELWHLRREPLWRPRLWYGVPYIGQDVATALMESVFHKHEWSTDPKCSISTANFSDRPVRAVGVPDKAVLCHLMSPGVLASYFGLNL